MPTPMLTLTFFFNFFNVDADEIADADANADANADVDANGDTNWKQVFLSRRRRRRRLEKIVYEILRQIFSHSSI